MRFFKIFSTLVVLSVFLYLVSFATDGSVYNDVVRLHIIANSDGEADQTLKMQVRDLILSTHGEALSAYSTKEEALSAAKGMLSAIEADVNAFLAAHTDYTARVTVEEKYFSTKAYGEYTLPRGNYTALCIRLGKAEGQNFFCVLYPPLCLGAASESGEALFVSHGLTKEEYELLRGERPSYRLKFRLLELFSGKE